MGQLAFMWIEWVTVLIVPLIGPNPKRPFSVFLQVKTRLETALQCKLSLRTLSISIRLLWLKRPARVSGEMGNEQYVMLQRTTT